MKKINLLFYVLALIGFAVSTTCSAETNFLHSTLSIESGRMILDKALCQDVQCRRKFFGPALAGSIQFANRFIFSLSNSFMSTSGPVWSATIDRSAGSLSIVNPIGNRADLQIGVTLSTLKVACSEGSCKSETVSGKSVGGKLNFWIDNSKTFAGKVGFLYSKYPISTSISTRRVKALDLGLSYYPSNRDEIYGYYSKQNNASTMALGYAHHF